MLSAELVTVVDDVGRAIEIVGVAVTAAAVTSALGRYILALITRRDTEVSYRRVRDDVGRGVLLGLEVLVAGDIIRTVGVDPTPESVAVLGGVVIIRTLLTVTIRTEVDSSRPTPAADRSSTRRASNG